MGQGVFVETHGRASLRVGYCPWFDVDVTIQRDMNVALQSGDPPVAHTENQPTRFDEETFFARA